MTTAESIVQLWLRPRPGSLLGSKAGSGNPHLGLRSSLKLEPPKKVFAQQVITNSGTIFLSIETILLDRCNRQQQQKPLRVSVVKLLAALKLTSSVSALPSVPFVSCSRYRQSANDTRQRVPISTETHGITLNGPEEAFLRRWIRGLTQNSFRDARIPSQAEVKSGVVRNVFSGVGYRTGGRHFTRPRLKKCYVYQLPSNRFVSDPKAQSDDGQNLCLTLKKLQGKL
ncbi:hypothetical protein EV360DRAFT_73160 [Lentinula raphanica]|nr:hypothetical protein EV360DRAFT_73160 [Lentinula raphanica]